MAPHYKVTLIIRFEERKRGKGGWVPNRGPSTTASSNPYLFWEYYSNDGSFFLTVPYYVHHTRNK